MWLALSSLVQRRERRTFWRTLLVINHPPFKFIVFGWRNWQELVDATGFQPVTRSKFTFTEGLVVGGCPLGTGCTESLMSHVLRVGTIDTFRVARLLKNRQSEDRNEKEEEDDDDEEKKWYSSKLFIVFPSKKDVSISIDDDTKSRKQLSRVIVEYFVFAKWNQCRWTAGDLETNVAVVDQINNRELFSPTNPRLEWTGSLSSADCSTDWLTICVDGWMAAALEHRSAVVYIDRPPWTRFVPVRIDNTTTPRPTERPVERLRVRKLTWQILTLIVKQYKVVELRAARRLECESNIYHVELVINNRKCKKMDAANISKLIIFLCKLQYFNN